MKLDVSKTFGSKRVQDNLKLEIRDNEIVAVIGVSGSGKTTLLNIISGTLDYDGEIVEAPKSVSYVFQSARLMPWATVGANLDFVMPRSIDKTERTRMIDDVLDKVELLAEKDNYPDSLSGGMAQRVALARAFVVDSDVLLMDEPFKGLDLRLKSKLIEAFRTLWQQDPRTTIIVTHDVDEALSVAHRIVILDQGRIDQEYNIRCEKAEQLQLIKEDIIENLTQK